MKHISLFLLLFCFSPSLPSQCFEPDPGIWLNTWRSCAPSPNPNPALGSTHWIEYDLGQVRTLSKSWVWNTNDPERLDQGFRRVRIDHSLDGENWTYYGTMDFPRGNGQAIYSGFPGPDLREVEARYVLLTALSNHGDPNCAGLAEIKFHLFPNPTAREVDLPGSCIAQLRDIGVEELTPFEALVLWENKQGASQPFYVFEIRIAGTPDWHRVGIEEPEIFLDELEPRKTYEFRIGVYCGEQLEYTGLKRFTTPEDPDAGGCYPPEDLLADSVSATTAHISWSPIDSAGYFLAAYREVGTEDWQTQMLTTPYVELAGLVPETNYESYIATLCGDREYWSERLAFKTAAPEGDVLTATDNEPSAEPDLNIYPNPGPGRFLLEARQIPSGRIKLQVNDQMGRLRWRHTAHALGDQDFFQIDLEHLPDGVYFLRILNEEETWQQSRRIVKISN